MNQESHYVLEGDDYVFYLQGRLAFKSSEVSVFVDRAKNVLILHGAPETVAKAYDKYRKALGLSVEMPASISVITGKFEIDELNKLVDDPTYAGEFYDRAMLEFEIKAARKADSLITKVRRKAAKSASKP